MMAGSRDARTVIQGGLAARAAEMLGRRRKRPPPVGRNGMLTVGSEAFRRVCAINEDGTYYFVPDRNDDAVAAELQELGEIWDLPHRHRRVSATLSSIAAANGTGVADAEIPTAGARRMLDALGEATRLRASDLKLVIRANHAVLRMRLGANEYTHGPHWQVREAEDAIAWLYDGRDYGDGAPAQQAGQHQQFSVGQEGRIALPEGLDALRCEKAPHGDGQDFIAARLIRTPEADTAGRIEDLGLDDDVLEALARERSSESGLVIIGGSTGDGKSTTLVRQLERLYQERDGEVSIMTAEDPIEYRIQGDGIVQMPVEGAAEGDARGAAYTRVLRTLLRSNPDVGMVSEIRTVDDCREVMQFVISGHKIFTTIHSFSANAVLFRLVSLGVDPRELAEPGVINLVMRQKLVPILCPTCARPAGEADRRAIEDWARVPDTRPKVRNRHGCPECLAGQDGLTARKAWAGLSRKRATAEFIALDDTYRRFVEDRDAHGALGHWLKPKAEGGLGGVTVQTRLQRLVAEGLADFEDVTRQRLPSSLREPGAAAA